MTKITRLPSEKSFGTFLIILSLILGSYFWWKGWSRVTVYVFFGLTFFIFVITIFIPRLLQPFNRAWFTLGIFLGRIMNPVVLGVIFFGLITPLSLALRATGRDVLHIRRKSMDSYWHIKHSSDTNLESFRNQF